MKYENDYSDYSDVPEYEYQAYDEEDDPEAIDDSTYYEDTKHLFGV